MPIKGRLNGKTKERELIRSVIDEKAKHSTSGTTSRSLQSEGLPKRNHANGRRVEIYQTKPRLQEPVPYILFLKQVPSHEQRWLIRATARLSNGLASGQGETQGPSPAVGESQTASGPAWLWTFVKKWLVANDETRGWSGNSRSSQDEGWVPGLKLVRGKHTLPCSALAARALE